MSTGTDHGHDGDGKTVTLYLHGNSANRADPHRVGLSLCKGRPNVLYFNIEDNFLYCSTFHICIFINSGFSRKNILTQYCNSCNFLVLIPIYNPSNDAGTSLVSFHLYNKYKSCEDVFALF